MAPEVRVAVDAIPFDGMMQAESGDVKVLFVRDAAGVRAFQGKCPHYGAPLAKGVICGKTLYCPWHKAAFDIGSGDLREPPALEHLDRYPVRIDGGEAVATLEPMPRHAPPTKLSGESIIIVGMGAAAVAAATALRLRGFAGRLVMIGREPGEPYDRPKLSKNFLAKKTPASAMRLEEQFFEKHRIEPQFAAVTFIDPQQRRIELEDGRVMTADRILIATGSRAARLPISGSDRANVFTLRSLDDAEAISAAAETARKVAIVGSGFIGVEAAAFLTKRGLEATVISPEALPYAKRFGDDVAKALKAHHEKNGIVFVTGKVDRFVGAERVEQVALENGEMIDADFVLIGSGAEPETDVVHADSKRDDGGLTVGADLQLAPGVWIAGDIAAFPDPSTGSTVRIEHWRLAQQHGMFVADAMLGDADAFAAAPFFWSTQGDKRLDYAGHASEWDEIATDGDTGALDFISYYVSKGTVQAACSVGRNESLTRYLHRLSTDGAPSLEEARKLSSV